MIPRLTSVDQTTAKPDGNNDTRMIINPQTPWDLCVSALKLKCDCNLLLNSCSIWMQQILILQITDGVLGALCWTVCEYVSLREKKMSPNVP